MTPLWIRSMIGLALIALGLPGIWAKSSSSGPVEPTPSSQLRDITGPEEVRLPDDRSSWLARLTLILAALASFGLVGWRIRRRRRTVPPLAADAWALAELDSIEKNGLGSLDDVAAFHARVSDVVRNYLELRFGWNASRQTTGEFLETMKRSSLLPAGDQELLADFLDRCDLAKFAGLDFDQGECHQLLAMARGFIRRNSGSARSKT